MNYWAELLNGLICVFGKILEIVKASTHSTAGLGVKGDVDTYGTVRTLKVTLVSSQFCLFSCL